MSSKHGEPAAAVFAAVESMAPAEEACDNCGQGAPGYLVVGDRRFCHPDYSQPCQGSGAK